MGAWGVKYNESDSHLDEVAVVIDSILEDLKKTINDSKNDKYIETFNRLRSHTILSSRMITSIVDDIPENSEAISDVFRDAISILSGLAFDIWEEWKDPREFIVALDAEISELKEWVDYINPRPVYSSGKASPSSINPSQVAANLAKLNNKNVPVGPIPTPVATPGGQALKFVVTTKVESSPNKNSGETKPRIPSPADVSKSSNVTVRVVPNRVAPSFTSQRIVIEGYSSDFK
jgi:hypothetical protein